MSFYGQEYKQGIVIQHSDKGSAFQETITAEIDGEVEINAKLPGGIKKLNLTGSGSGDRGVFYVEKDPDNEDVYYILKPDTKERYSDGNQLTAEEALALLNEFVEDYNLGTPAVVSHQEGVYEFDNIYVLNNYNFDVDYSGVIPDQHVLESSLNDLVEVSFYYDTSYNDGFITIYFTTFLGNSITLWDYESEH